MCFFVTQKFATESVLKCTFTVATAQGECVSDGFRGVPGGWPLKWGDEHYALEIVFETHVQICKYVMLETSLALSPHSPSDEIQTVTERTTAAQYPAIVLHCVGSAMLVL